MSGFVNWEITDQLAQDLQTILFELEKLLIFAPNNEGNSEITISKVVKMYSQAFDAQKLKNIASDVARSSKTYRESQHCFQILTSVYILSIPVTTCTAKRIFFLHQALP